MPRSERQFLKVALGLCTFFLGRSGHEIEYDRVLRGGLQSAELSVTYCIVYCMKKCCYDNCTWNGLWEFVVVLHSCLR